MTRARPIAHNLWIVDGPAVRWFTMPFPTRMTIARLADGGLFVHSPIELTAEVREAVAALGIPRYLVSPNKIHHLFWAEWQDAYQDALSFSPPGLGKKRPDLVFHGELGNRPESAWAQDIDQMIFQGSRVLDEVVFFHRSSHTVIFGDLVENFDPRSLSWFHRALARFGKVLAPHGQTPIDYRWSFRTRHAEARESLWKLLDWQPRRIIMCHGIPVEENALPFIESAFAWLGKGG